MSGRVQGMETVISSADAALGPGMRVIRVNSWAMAECERDRLVQELMYDALVVMVRKEMSGERRVDPSAKTIFTGSILSYHDISLRFRNAQDTTHVYGSSQYSENNAATMFTTIWSLVSSVAVTSMNTFRVLRLILLCSELMIGGKDSTRSLES